MTYSQISVSTRFGATPKTKEILEAGDCLVVPKKLWHRQISHHGAKIMFITSIEGNKTCMDEVPA